jgi:hypothetical protein
MNVVKAIENGVIYLYDAVIRWILTRVVMPRRQFGADFLRQDVNDRGWSHAVHGECQQMVLVSHTDPFRRLGSRQGILRSRGRQSGWNLMDVALEDGRSRAFLD